MNVIYAGRELKTLKKWYEENQDLFGNFEILVNISKWGNIKRDNTKLELEGKIREIIPYFGNLYIYRVDNAVIEKDLCGSSVTLAKLKFFLWEPEEEGK